MKVLLSVKPEYARRIFDGTKHFEFRKVIFKHPNITTVVVYASSPVQKVIGEFQIDEIISASPEEIWGITKEFSGISSDFFFEYFNDREIAHAIKIRKPKLYAKALSLKEEYDMPAPQSYRYLN